MKLNNYEWLETITIIPGTIHLYIIYYESSPGQYHTPIDVNFPRQGTCANITVHCAKKKHHLQDKKSSLMMYFCHRGDLHFISIFIITIKLQWSTHYAWKSFRGWLHKSATTFVQGSDVATCTLKHLLSPVSLQFFLTLNFLKHCFGFFCFKFRHFSFLPKLILKQPELVLF